MVENFLLQYWDIIVGIAVAAIWLNRTTARMEQRIINLEMKMTAIWERYNSLIDKLLQHKER